MHKGFGCVALGVAFLLLIAACSPAPDDASEQEYPDAAENAAPLPEEDLDQEMIQHGWRPGLLEIEVTIQQDGAHEEVSPNTRIESQWSTYIYARSSQSVMVVEDFRLSVPATGDEDVRRSAFESEPWYVLDSAAPAATDSRMSNTLRWRSSTPTANDYTLMTREIEAAGTVEDLVLEDLHLSLFGEGYEARLSFVVNGEEQKKEAFILASSGARQEINEQNRISEGFSFSLLPAPAQQLNDYPFWEEGTPPDLIAMQRQYQQEKLALLQHIAADNFEVQTDLRAGLVTTAEQDSLVLSYHYADNKQAPFLAGIDGFTNKIFNNSLSIKISLRASPVESP